MMSWITLLRYLELGNVGVGLFLNLFLGCEKYCVNLLPFSNFPMSVTDDFFF